tara:strand:- start:352 stop:579 length:228 start_codon:yes stop_codon:yes gene_type:complete
MTGDEHTEEDAVKLVQAYLTFTSQFSEYIREVDNNLWNKAIDFAKDYTNIDGVILKDVRDLMDIQPEDFDDSDED